MSQSGIEQADLARLLLLCIRHILANVLLRDRVVVYHEIVALQTIGMLGIVLEVDPVLDGAQVVPEVDETRTLDT